MRNARPDDFASITELMTLPQKKGDIGMTVLQKTLIIDGLLMQYTACMKKYTAFHTQLMLAATSSSVLTFPKCKLVYTVLLKFICRKEVDG